MELFCDVDDFCRDFAPRWRQRLIAEGERQRRREAQLVLSEVLTILIASQIEHTRRRSPINFLVNLVANTHQSKKPSLNLNPQEAK